MPIGKVIQPNQLATIGPVKAGELGPSKSKKSESALDTFSDLLKDGVNKVDSSIKDHEKVVKNFANGDKVNLHELVIKGEHADLNLRLMMTIRSKVVEAYQEVMRMPV